MSSLAHKTTHIVNHWQALDNKGWRGYGRNDGLENYGAAETQSLGAEKVLKLLKNILFKKLLREPCDTQCDTSNRYL